MLIGARFRAALGGSEGRIGIRLDRGLDGDQISEIAAESDRTTAPKKLAAELDNRRARTEWPARPAARGLDRGCLGKDWQFSSQIRLALVFTQSLPASQLTPSLEKYE
jgi:hypothetical protein